MGNYYFTCATTGKETKVEYTFGYTRCADGEVRICVHHSSIPYSAAESGTEPPIMGPECSQERSTVRLSLVPPSQWVWAPTTGSNFSISTFQFSIFCEIWWTSAAFASVLRHGLPTHQRCVCGMIWSGQDTWVDNTVWLPLDFLVSIWWSEIVETGEISLQFILSSFVGILDSVRFWDLLTFGYFCLVLCAHVGYWPYIASWWIACKCWHFFNSCYHRCGDILGALKIHWKSGTTSHRLCLGYVSVIAIHPSIHSFIPIFWLCGISGHARL
jgi:hypothetical protein